MIGRTVRAGDRVQGDLGRVLWRLWPVFGVIASRASLRTRCPQPPCLHRLPTWRDNTFCSYHGLLCCGFNHCRKSLRRNDLRPESRDFTVWPIVHPAARKFYPIATTRLVARLCNCLRLGRIQSARTHDNRTEVDRWKP